MNNYRKSFSTRSSSGYLFRAVGLMFFLILFVYVVFGILATGETISAFERQYNDQLSTLPESTKNIYMNENNHKLLKEKAFLMSKLETSKSDSISLWIDLADSSAILAIKGVVVHRAKIERYSKSAFFTEADPALIHLIIQNTSIITGSKSSIEKEPVFVKKAPTDSLQAELFNEIPDTSFSPPVFYTYLLDNNCHLNIRQTELKSGADYRVSFLFDLNNKWDVFKKLSGSVFQFHTPRYHPEITLHLPENDARIIYRALPSNAMVSIGL